MELISGLESSKEWRRVAKQRLGFANPVRVRLLGSQTFDDHHLALISPLLCQSEVFVGLEAPISCDYSITYVELAISETVGEERGGPFRSWPSIDQICKQDRAAGQVKVFSERFRADGSP